MERFVFDGNVEPRAREKRGRTGKRTQVAMIALLSASRSLRWWFVAPLERRTRNAFLKSGGPKLIVGARREGRGRHKFRAIRSVPEKFFVPSAEMAEIRILKWKVSGRPERAFIADLSSSEVSTSFLRRSI